MTVSADQVVIELLARVDKAEADIKRYAQNFERGMKKVQGDSNAMEAAIRRDADSVSSTLKGLAGSFAAFFSAQRVGELADGYTRFTNQLKVAGLEGEGLAKTQERLFTIAQQYGVELESIGTLYGRSASSAKELNLSQEQQYKIVEAVSASLKVSGQTATEAAGALLQLSQVLGGTTVQAEEYNSLIDGARPLLQAVAAGSEKWAGSVGKLTRDVKEGKVQVREFVQALLKGADGVIGQAEQATLTLSGAFTILNNSLGKYVGETDKSLSATQRISQAIIYLADNIGFVAKALAVISAILLGRFTAGMVTAASTSRIAADALFAVQARALGAATSMEALAFASATAGRALLAAFGGWIGIGVTALAIGIGVVAANGFEAAKASKEYLDANNKLASAQKTRAELEERIATATGKTRDETLKGATEARNRAQIEGRLAVALLRRAQAEAEAQRISAKARLAQEAQAMGGGTGVINLDRARQQGRFMGGNVMASLFGGGELSSLDQADADLSAASAAVIGWAKEVQRLDALINSSVTPVTPDGKKNKKTGPTAEEIEARYVQEMARLKQEQIQAELAVTTSAERRLELQQQLLDIEYKARVADILSDKNFSDKKKAAYVLALSKLYGQDAGEGDETGSPLVKQILRARDRQVAEEERGRADAQAGVERDLLQSSLDMAETRQARRAIELRLLDNAYEAERRALEDQRNDLTISKAKRDEAQLRLDRLDDLKAGDQRAIEQRYEGPLASYMRSIPDTADKINDALENVAVGGLRDVEDGFARAATKALGLKGAIGSIVQELIKLAFQQTVLKALFGLAGGIGGGGGPIAGGGFSSFSDVLRNNSNFSMSFGGFRANGGPVAAGGTYIVGERGPEILRMGAQGGVVIPNHQIAAPGGGGTTVVQNFTLDARGGITTPQLLAQVNSTITQAGTAAALAGGVDGERRVMRRATRRIPG